MYEKDRQVSLFDFDMSAARLDPDNFWLRLAAVVPWDELEDKYAEKFALGGPKAHSARYAVGALVVKRVYRCTDEWVVRHVAENPYIQSFIGLTAFAERCPFGASTVARFRKRIDAADIDTIMAMDIRGAF